MFDRVESASEHVRMRETAKMLHPLPLPSPTSDPAKDGLRKSADTLLRPSEGGMEGTLLGLQLAQALGYDTGTVVDAPCCVVPPPHAAAAVVVAEVIIGLQPGPRSARDPEGELVILGEFALLLFVVEEECSLAVRAAVDDVGCMGFGCANVGGGL